MNRIMVLAIGGAGCNMTETIMRLTNAQWLKDASYIFADSDAEHLSELDKKGLVTLKLQHNSNLFPTDNLKGVDKLYILAGLGGITGSRFAEIAAKSAQATGIKDIALIVTTPFVFEGSEKMAKATTILCSLSGFPVKVLHNEELAKRYPDINFINAFEYSDKEAISAIESGQI